jgi:hypothetical protein
MGLDAEGVDEARVRGRDLAVSEVVRELNMYVSGRMDLPSKSI